MLHKTEGIVLNYIKYKESSIIVRIYTRKFGLTSYIVNGARSSKGKNKIAFFQPLTLLDMVVYENPKTEIQRISEVRCPNPFLTLPADIKKATIGIFITELLVKCLKGTEQHEAMFDFISQSVLILEHLQSKYSNFHLQFLLKLSRYLGFSPSNALEINEQLIRAGYKIQLNTEQDEMINNLINEGYENMFHIDHLNRKIILERILQFYHLHNEGMTEIKSLSVLNTIFH